MKAPKDSTVVVVLSVALIVVYATDLYHSKPVAPPITQSIVPEKLTPQELGSSDRSTWPVEDHKGGIAGALRSGKACFKWTGADADTSGRVWVDTDAPVVSRDEDHDYEFDGVTLSVLNGKKIPRYTLTTEEYKLLDWFVEVKRVVEKPKPADKKADKSSAKKKQGKYLDAPQGSVLQVNRPGMDLEWVHPVLQGSDGATLQTRLPEVPSRPASLSQDGKFWIDPNYVAIYPESTLESAPEPCVADWKMAEAIADFLDKNADKYKDTPESIRTLAVTLRGLFPCLARKMK